MNNGDAGVKNSQFRYYLMILVKPYYAYTYKLFQGRLFNQRFLSLFLLRCCPVVV
jgi:hypothetical protein